MENIAEEFKHYRVELLRSLQWREMAYTRKKNEFRVWDVSGKIFGMFAFDEFILLAMYDHHLLQTC